MITSVLQLFAVLGRDPNELIGQPETAWLDFKGRPYRLDRSNRRRDKECFELAKDVSALANAKGGILLIGVRTELQVELREETAKKLRSVSPGKVDPKQIQEVIWDWVQPKLNVEIQTHPVPGRQGALWSVFVERQQERDLPFIVAREFVDKRGGPSRNLFAVYVRVGSQNSPYPPPQVQHWIHEGWKAPLEKPPSVAISVREEATAALSDDLSAIGAEAGTCCYYLQASPGVPTDVQRFYRGASDPLYETLFSIPHLRSAGFNLPDGLEPERTRTGGLRVVRPGHDSISATPKGLTTAIEGQENLTWASLKAAPEGELWINPLALVEFTLEFWRFYLGQIQARMNGPQTIVCRAGMTELGDPLPLYLPSSFVRRSVRQRAHDDNFDLEWVSTEGCDPGRLAFEVLRRVYARFGLAEEIIPWAEDRQISERAILDVRRGGDVS